MNRESRQPTSKLDFQASSHSLPGWKRTTLDASILYFGAFEYFKLVNKLANAGTTNILYYVFIPMQTLLCIRAMWYCRLCVLMTGTLVMAKGMRRVRRRSLGSSISST
jgi:hypothetical protein